MECVAAPPAPTLQVEVVLGVAFSARLKDDATLGSELADSVTQELQSICNALGSCAVLIVNFAGSELALLLSVAVNGRKLQFAEHLILEIAEYCFSGPLANPQEAGRGPGFAAPADLIIRRSMCEERGVVLDFLTRLVIEVVKQNPETLFPCIAAIQALAIGSECFPEQHRHRLLPIVQELAQLGTPLTAAASLRMVAESMVAGLSDEEIVERVVAEVQPSVVEVHLSPDYLRRLSEPDGAGVEPPNSVERFGPEAIQKQFSFLIESIFYELGVRVPEIKIVTKTYLKDRSMAVQIGCLPGVPRKGLLPGQVLAAEMPSEMEAHAIASYPRVSPIGLLWYSLIEQLPAARVPAGVVTWTPLGFITLMIAVELRRHARRLINRGAVEFELALLRDVYPDLVALALETCTITQITRMLRLLLSEGLMIRNMAAILESILRHHYGVVCANPEMANLRNVHCYVQRIREDLRDYISFISTNELNGNLVVLLLDPAIEDRLGRHLDGCSICDDELEGFRDAVRSALSTRRGYAVPSILSKAEIRSCVRTLLEQEFPAIRVVSYSELAPETMVQPIERISLPALQALQPENGPGLEGLENSVADQ